MNWRHEDVYFSANEYYLHLVQDIQRAQTDIVLEAYIFSHDEVGLNIIEALKAAAGRGVTIRVLIDGVGSIDDGAGIARELMACGIHVRIYHPVPWNFKAYQYALKKGNILSRFLYFISNINNRDHRKLAIIDRKIAWVGSINISHQHIDDGSSLGWKDAAARVEGYAVRSLYDDFDYVWQSKLHEGFIRQARFYLSNYSDKARKRKNTHLLQQINQAKKRIYITNAYFSPTRLILDAIKSACQRGIDVQVILSGKSDIAFLFPAITSTYYADMLAAGIRVYEFHETILHAKSIIIDDIAIVGSTNLNYRSALHDLELDVFLGMPSTIKNLEDEFERNKSGSQEIDVSILKNYSRWLLYRGLLSRFLRYWI